jgi:hypothetical protein
VSAVSEEACSCGVIFVFAFEKCRRRVDYDQRCSSYFLNLFFDLLCGRGHFQDTVAEPDIDGVGVETHNFGECYPALANVLSIQRPSTQRAALPLAARYHACPVKREGCAE